MLKLASDQPEWVEIVPAAGDVPAVRVKFAPIGRQAVRAARAAIRAAIATDADDWAASDALSMELLRRGILDWEGIGDRDGAPLAVTPDSVALFLADVTAFEAADRAYVMPWARRDQEKNVSAPSPAGTSAGATAADATATSAATGGTRAAAPATRPPARKPPRARTSRTNRKPKPGAPSGT